MAIYKPNTAAVVNTRVVHCVTSSCAHMIKMIKVLIKMSVIGIKYSKTFYN